MVRNRMAVRRKTQRGNARRRSRLAWAALTVVPWCLAAGLLVSMGADAGQDPVIGTTRMDLTDLAAAMPGDLVPMNVAGAGFPLPPHDMLSDGVRRAAGELRGAGPDADEIEPRPTLKDQSRPAPLVTASLRRDPAVAVRPTFAIALRAPGSLPRYRAAVLAFGPGDAEAAAEGFTPGPVDGPWADPTRLQPLPPDLSVTTRPTHAANSPAAAAGSTTPPVEDGSTPVVQRAVSLASTTPAPADGAPIEIAALPRFSRGPHGLVTGNATVVGIALPHPDYAAMIETAKSESQQRCLAQAVYFEARSEPEEGQAAVAQVVLNRAMSGLYPGSVCGVVFQNQQHRNACQFSFACDGHPLRVTEDEAWTRAQRVAREVTDGSTYVSDIGAATHYHATYVRPGWSRSLQRTEAIGHHIFYKLRPGQT